MWPKILSHSIWILQSNENALFCRDYERCLAEDTKAKWIACVLLPTRRIALAAGECAEALLQESKEGRVFELIYG